SSRGLVASAGVDFGAAFSGVSLATSFFASLGEWPQKVAARATSTAATPAAAHHHGLLQRYAQRGPQSGNAGPVAGSSSLKSRNRRLSVSAVSRAEAGRRSGSFSINFMMKSEAALGMVSQSKRGAGGVSLASDAKTARVLVP